MIRAALADRNGSLLAHELGSRGLDPADALAIRLFGEWSPAGIGADVSGRSAP